MLVFSAPGTGELLQLLMRPAATFEAWLAHVTPAASQPGVSPSPLVTTAPQVPEVVAPSRLQFSGRDPLDFTPNVRPFGQALTAQWQPGDWVAAIAGILFIVVLTAVSVLALRSTLDAWRTASRVREIGFSPVERDPSHSFLSIVHALGAGGGLADTLTGLANQQHARHEVVAVVAEDDAATLAAARRAVTRHPGIVSVIVYRGQLRRSEVLNLAREGARGDVIGIFDGTAVVHPQLLRLVDSRLAETGADALQTGVQRTYFASHWWSLHSALDNYFWQRSQLPSLAEAQTLTLGGNATFVRREWLEFVGGWDPKSTSPDGGLGVALSSAGAQLAAVYSPDVVTYERGIPSISAGIRDRIEFNRGIIGLLRRGGWRNLPHSAVRLRAPQRLTVTLIAPIAGVLIPTLLLAVVALRPPTLFAVLALIPLAPMLVSGAVRLAGLAELGALFKQKMRVRDYACVIAGALPHQAVLLVALILTAFPARDLRQENPTDRFAGQPQLALAGGRP